MNIKTISFLVAGGLLLSACGEQAKAPTPKDGGVTDKDYTMAEVGQHTTKDDCWVVVEGKVYDVTGLIGKHSGGDQAILSNCGKDATVVFNARPAKDNTPHPETARERLNQMLLGILKT